MMATRTLDLAAGKLFVTLQVLLAMGAGEFEFAHGAFRFGAVKKLNTVKTMLTLQSHQMPAAYRRS